MSYVMVFYNIYTVTESPRDGIVFLEANRGINTDQFPWLKATVFLFCFVFSGGGYKFMILKYLV